MKKIKVIKQTNEDGTDMHLVQKRHRLLPWKWVNTEAEVHKDDHSLTLKTGMSLEPGEKMDIIFGQPEKGLNKRLERLVDALFPSAVLMSIVLLFVLFPVMLASAGYLVVDLLKQF